MSVKVEFVAAHAPALNSLIAERDDLKPQPAFKCLPSWFKHMPSHRNEFPTAKRCLPLVDAMYQGYVIKAHCSIHVKIKDNGDLDATFKSPANPLEVHRISQTPEFIEYFESPYTHVFKWLSPWAIRTPKGYSCMYMNPQNGGYKELRFMSGNVDTDEFFIRINPTFILQKGFKEFKINAGDPLVQVVPFKREDFKLEVRAATEEDMLEEQKSNWAINLPHEDAYRDNYWHRRKQKG